MSLSYCVAIDDPSRVAESRRLATDVARLEGFSEQEISNAAIVASELASNLSKHAKRGELHILPLSRCEGAGIEMVSVDHGPGFTNLSDSMIDGHSSTGTSGTGLGAVRRLSDQFDVHSVRDSGSVLISRMFSRAAERKQRNFEIGVVGRPLRGETASGDGWAVRFEGGSLLVLVVDGLGHGLMANAAANAAVESFENSKETGPELLLRGIHQAARGTRGAAVAVVRIDSDAGEIRFAGLGNISGVVVTGTRTQSMVSHYGTAGHEGRIMREFVYPWSRESLLVMHSDGLSANWNYEAIRPVRHSMPSMIGAVLYKEFGRDRDDACVLVGKYNDRSQLSSGSA